MNRLRHQVFVLKKKKSLQSRDENSGKLANLVRVGVIDFIRGNFSRLIPEISVDGLRKCRRGTNHKLTYWTLPPNRVNCVFFLVA